MKNNQLEEAIYISSILRNEISTFLVTLWNKYRYRKSVVIIKELMSKLVMPGLSISKLFIGSKVIDLLS